ncbi:MAG: aspartyl protease family protein [Gemmatimonadales bacterium]
MTTGRRLGTTALGTILSLASSGCAQGPADRGSDGGATGIAEISYRKVKHQRLISLEIRGRGPFTFLIDTGVSGAAIDLALALQLGIELPAEASAREPEVQPIYQTWITGLAIGTLRLDSLQAAALPLAAFGERLGEPLHGVLGDGFMNGRVIRFDDASETIAFGSSPQAFEDDFRAADYVVPLVLSSSGGMPLLEVTLGDRSFMATLDMGSSLGLEVFTPYAEELGLGHARAEWKRDSVLGGSLGRAEILDGVVARIEIGPLSFQDVPTSITPPRSERNRKGNLGNRLWTGYVLTLDYVGGRIAFRKP